MRDLPIIGMDEAGRGAFAGPLVAASVLLTHPAEYYTKTYGTALKDSKLLSPTQRELLFFALYESGATIEIEVIDISRINIHGIGWANKEVFRKLVSKIQGGRAIIDGNYSKEFATNPHVSSMPKADQIVPQVSAASIIAKVSRDAIMQKLHALYPQYGFDKNKGYGTKSHIKALQTIGMSPCHRTLFVNTALS